MQSCTLFTCWVTALLNLLIKKREKGKTEFLFSFCSCDGSPITFNFYACLSKDEVIKKIYVNKYVNNNASQTWETMTAVLCYIVQRYSPIKIPFASGGLGNSRMFAHDNAAAFLSIYKKQQQQQKTGV